ncbi:unnamed protein product [Peniophora sp. CBMAI 1063]|nr:unnamed protein product [Peniophora sp. CBMAI 1063]
MAQQRRASRRHTAVNNEATVQAAEAEAAGLEEHAATIGHVNGHDNNSAEATMKEVTTSNSGAGIAEVEVEIDAEKLKAEEALFESFREEFHEALEQLPLYLHRQLTLMRNLDKQTSQHSSDLLSAINRFIDLRSKLAGIPLKATLETSAPSDPAAPTPVHPTNDAEPQPANPDTASGEAGEAGRTQAPEGSQTNAVAGPSNGEPPSTTEQERRLVNGTGPPDTAPQAPEEDFDETPISWDATRTLLPRIGWLTDEILRTSEEKINLAETIHGMIQRHIRQLVYCIQDQEAIIKTGHSYQPERVVAPRLHRPNQYTVLSNNLADDEPPEPVQVEVPKTPGRKRRGRPPNARVAHPTPNGTKTGIKIRLPAFGQGQYTQIDGAADESYCVCHRPSSGTMVMCDNGDACENGSWFHLECLGMKEAPDDDWYCPKCAPLMDLPQKPAKRRRRG